MDNYINISVYVISYLNQNTIPK